MRWLIILLLGLHALLQMSSCKSKEENLAAQFEALDSLQYQIKALDFKDQQFSSDPAIQSRYSFTYFEFSEDLPKGTKDSLLSLMATFLAGSEKQIHVMPDFKKMAEDMFKEFAASTGEYSPFAGWEISRSIRPAGKKGILQSIECSEMSFMGGAHPNSVWNYKVMDLSNGQTVLLSDLIAADQMEAFNQLRFKTFEDNWNSRGEDLNWKDYYFPESFVKEGPFYTNDNFYISAEGLTLFYNQYEIAPYASGVTELTISWDALEMYLDKEGEYYRYLTNKAV